MQTRLSERKARFLKYWEPRRQNKRRFLLKYALPYSLLFTLTQLLLDRDPIRWPEILLGWAVTLPLMLASGYWIWNHNEKTYRNYLEESGLE